MSLPLSPNDVEVWVQRISKLTHDPTFAHSQEDKLWREVLEKISETAPDPVSLAREALKTRQIKFPRWYE